MQGIFAGRTQLRYPYGRYGYTRGGGKIWHGGMDLVGLDSTDIRMPYYKNKRITGKVVRARRVTDHSNKTWIPARKMRKTPMLRRNCSVFPSAR